jgi:hypothetical protein
VDEMNRIMTIIEAKRKEKEEEDARKDKEEGEVKERGGTPYKCGGVTEKYLWNQTLVDMIISIPMPTTMTKDKINVKFSEDHCHISIKGEEDKPILHGKWHDRIDVRPGLTQVYETIWTLEEYEGNKVMNVFLSKFHDFQVWWDCVVEGEPKIDTGKVSPEESNMQYMDDDIKAEVDKAMYDQRQRALGLPTIEQQQNQQKMYCNGLIQGGNVQEEPRAQAAVRWRHAGTARQGGPQGPQMGPKGRK